MRLKPRRPKIAPGGCRGGQKARFNQTRMAGRCQARRARYNFSNKKGAERTAPCQVVGR